MSAEFEAKLEELYEYLKAGEEYILPFYKELPSVELYMEQVLKYVNSTLQPIAIDDKLLTSFMVNNYVKAKIVDEPVRKKYSKEQIGYLIAITLMKTTLSMSDMAVLLEFESSVSDDKKKLYEFWSSLEMEILNSSSEEAAERVRKVISLYKHEIKKSDGEAEALALDRLAYYALRLSIEAQANRLLSQAIIAMIREQKQGEAIPPSVAEVRQSGLAAGMEANRVAANKRKAAQKKNMGNRHKKA